MSPTTTTFDAPRESAPERDYGVPEPRPTPVESDFDRAPATESWAPPAEPRYRDEPRETQASSEPEAAPPPADERQAS